MLWIWYLIFLLNFSSQDANGFEWSERDFTHCRKEKRKKCKIPSTNVAHTTKLCNITRLLQVKLNSIFQFVKRHLTYLMFQKNTSIILCHLRARRNEQTWQAAAQKRSFSRLDLQTSDSIAEFKYGPKSWQKIFVKDTSIREKFL